jgi:hypothetical protein
MNAIRADYEARDAAKFWAHRTKPASWGVAASRSSSRLSRQRPETERERVRRRIKTLTGLGLPVPEVLRATT